MRIVSPLGVLIVTTLVTGCSMFGSKAPTPGGLSAGGSAAFPAKSGGGGSSIPGASTVAAVGTGIVGGVTGIFKRGDSAPSGPKTPKMAENDPTSLSSKSKVTPDLHLTMAQMQERAGNADAAKIHYEAVLKEKPKNLEALLGLAHLLDRQGKMVEAADKYRLACKYYPKDARAHNDLGLCLGRQQKFDESLKMMAKAIELDPTKKLYRNNMATVLTEMGRTNEAYSQLKVAHGPAVAHYNLGCLLYQKGNKTAAAEQFAAASKEDPSLAVARQWSEQLAAADAPADNVTQTQYQANTMPVVVAPSSSGPLPTVVPPGASAMAPVASSPAAVAPSVTTTAAPAPTVVTEAASAGSRGVQTPPQRVAEAPRPLPAVEDTDAPARR